MAYLLRFDGVNDYISYPNFTLSSAGDYVEIDADIKNSLGYFFGAAPNVFGSILSYDATRYRMRVASSGTVAEITAPTPVGRKKTRITRSATGYTLTVDGVSLGSFNLASGFSPSITGIWSGTNVSTLDLYGIVVFLGGVTTRIYDASASNGSGNTLVNTLGGNDAALINFSAVDADKWIFYSDGGTAYTLTPIAGALSLTGSPVNLLRNAALTPQAGAFTLTGSPVSTLRNALLTPQSGSYTITGSSVTVLRNALLTPEQGAYTITGSPVELVYDAVAVGYVLTPVAGELALSGQAVNLLADRLLLPDAGAYTITGADVGTFYGRSLTPDSGGYTITGSQVDLLANRLLTPESGVFVLTGAPVNLDYSGFIRRLVYGSCVHYVDKAETIAFAPNLHTIAFAPNNATIHYKQLEDC